MHQLRAQKMFMPGHTPSNCRYSVCMLLHIYNTFLFILSFPALIFLSAWKVAFYSCHGLIFCNCLLEYIIIDILHIVDIALSMWKFTFHAVVMLPRSNVRNTLWSTTFWSQLFFTWYFLSSRFFNIYNIINNFGTSKMLVCREIYILYVEVEETMFNVCCLQELVFLKWQSFHQRSLSILL